MSCLKGFEGCYVGAPGIATRAGTLLVLRPVAPKTSGFRRLSSSALTSRGHSKRSRQSRPRGSKGHLRANSRPCTRCLVQGHSRALWFGLGFCKGFVMLFHKECGKTLGRRNQVTKIKFSQDTERGQWVGRSGGHCCR